MMNRQAEADKALQDERDFRDWQQRRRNREENERQSATMMTEVVATLWSTVK